MKIYFIRHAEGYHNLPPLGNTKNYDIKYPKITENGFSQIDNTKSLLKNENIEIILVSPLRRTLQTAGGIFNKDKDLFIANEDIREIVTNPCDLRRDIDKIEAEFPFIDFSQVEKKEKFCVTETIQSYNKRMDNFYKWLSENTYKSIAVVSHGVFLHTFLRKYGEKLGIEDLSYFNNCECRIGKI